MIFVTKYRVKPFLSNEELKSLLEVHAAHGDSPGALAHYVAADQSHGIVIAEFDDAGPSYQYGARLRPWMEFDVTPMLTLDDALPRLLDALG